VLERPMDPSHSRQRHEEETKEWILKMATNAPADEQPACCLLLRLKQKQHLVRMVLGLQIGQGAHGALLHTRLPRHNLGASARRRQRNERADDAATHQ